MASRAVVGIFLLSAVPLLCLELRRGIPGLEEEKKEEEENELRQRQRLVRKRQQEAQGEKGNEDLVIENTSQTSSETSNREAAKRRNLDKLVTEVSPPAEWPWQKQVPDLPEEPSETDEEVITIALRRPSGNVLRRRFFKSCSSQVLFDWMRKIGYHPSLYSLSTSFPRKPLEVEEGCSLADIGITVDTILIVEEKEQGN
ncbi:PREDICTED: UBX domain-containing protein 8 isoform X3 [Dipodomys ordii]|uniref:UBX domain-containing protein 8 isoform X3 n=1 Tax=Dipodomys ordii TaxID=10020 RepID=A0A1S3FW24_DIPOR|nr:PREDICTED: UBX domain-containing protein 8 isoform X3 [Dipodomys ordii]